MATHRVSRLLNSIFSGARGALISVLALVLLTGRVSAGTVSVCNEANLRAAMQGGGIVTFACDGTITLTSPLVVTSDTVLDATGRQVTISGGNSVGILEVGERTRLNVRGLTLADGSSRDSGAAIYNGWGSGSVVLQSVTLRSNSVAQNFFGGGGAIDNRGTLTASNCTFLNNVASSRGGGALRNEANATLVNCTFIENLAVGFWGGGVNNIGELFITNCTFATTVFNIGGYRAA